MVPLRRLLERSRRKSALLGGTKLVSWLLDMDRVCRLWKVERLREPERWLWEALKVMREV